MTDKRGGVADKSRFWFIVLIVLVGCGGGAMFCFSDYFSYLSDRSSESRGLEVIAPEFEMSITPSASQVPEFMKLQNGSVEEYGEEYGAELYYNITPDFIADHSNFLIFKNIISGMGYIMYENEIYITGSYFGGYGITGMALADINQDGCYELYYTYSCGSGIPRSEIGYFDPVTGDTVVFDEAFFLSQIMLTGDEAGDLCVRTAKTAERDSMVEYSIEAEDFLGRIVNENNKITLIVD